MSTSANAGPIERGSQITAGRILDVAEQLFAQRGYAGTTLRAIAAGVGIQNPSLYKHFKNKAAIYDAVITRAIHPILYEFWDTEDEIARVMQHFANHPQVAQLILQELTAASEDGTSRIASWLAAAATRTSDWLPDQPPASPDAIPLRVLAMSNLITAYFATAASYQALTGRDPLSPEVLAEQTKIIAIVSQALFANLGAPSPEASS